MESDGPVDQRTVPPVGRLRQEDGLLVGHDLAVPAVDGVAVDAVDACGESLPDERLGRFGCRLGRRGDVGGRHERPPAPRVKTQASVSSMTGL